MIDKLIGEQKEAANQLLSFIRGDEKGTRFFCLRGYAGTGKTFTISAVIKYLMELDDYDVALTAPTNKAVSVLRRMCSIKDVQYVTIHSLLGLKLLTNEFGEQYLQEDKYAKFKQKKFPDIIIVDEVSMLNMELFRMLDKKASKARIIFMGDPAQIPPVKEKESIPLDDEQCKIYHIQHLTLIKIRRQKEENTIKAVTMALRNDLDSFDPIVNHRESNQYVKFSNLGVKEEAGEVGKLLNFLFTSSMFEGDADYAKVIAWTNDSVDKYNASIRKMIYKDVEKLDFIMKGEKIIIDKPYLVKEAFKDPYVLFTVNQEVTVENVYNVCKDENDYFVYMVDVKYYDYYEEKVKCKEGVPILHENSLAKFNFDQERIKQQALGYLKLGNYRSNKTQWKLFYTRQEDYLWIKHNYAITAHKSQGSTYQNVIALEYDLNKHPQIVERNRIKYTTFTRPSEKLYIVTWDKNS